MKNKDISTKTSIIILLIFFAFCLIVRHEHTKDVNAAYSSGYARGYDEVVCQVYKDLIKDGINPNKYVTMDTDTLKGCLGN